MYLDNSATTRPKKKYLEEFSKVEYEIFGNASSKYYPESEDAKKIIATATETIKKKLKSQDSSVIFTSGATEANNIFVQGIIKAHSKGHIITTATEHSSVLEIIKYYEKKGFDVTYIYPKNGTILAKDVLDAVQVDTILVTIVFVNGETGHINPIEELSNNIKLKMIPFYSDFTQAIGKLHIELDAFKYLDAIGLSGHKIRSPKGIGAILIRNDMIHNLVPLYFGGEQQYGLRPGTLPNGLIHSLACAVNDIDVDIITTVKIKDNLIKAIKDKLDDSIIVNFEKDYKIANIISVRFVDVFNERFLKVLSEYDIMSASSGTACSVTKPSHVLAAYGLTSEEISQTIRMSITSDTILDYEKLEKI